MGKFARHCICPQQDALVHLLIQTYKLTNPLFWNGLFFSPNFVFALLWLCTSNFKSFPKNDKEIYSWLLSFFFSFRRKTVTVPSCSRRWGSIMNLEWLQSKMFSSCVSRIYRAMLFIQTVLWNVLFSVNLINTFRNAHKSEAAEPQTPS